MPHSLARFMISFTSDTPSISLIFVWQWSSTRLTGLLSMRLSVKSSHFLIPETDPIVSSPSNRSRFATPLMRTKRPVFTASFKSSSAPSLANIFTVIVSVKSLTLNRNSVLPLRSSLHSEERILPRITTVPISPSSLSSSTASPSKSRPYSTSG